MPDKKQIYTFNKIKKIFWEIHEFIYIYTYDRRSDIKERLPFLLRNSYKKEKFTSRSASPVSEGVPFALQNRLSDKGRLQSKSLVFNDLERLTSFQF